VKSILLAAGALLMILRNSPTAAEDIKAAISAGMAVYAHIVETEATIDVCRRIDVADLTSYNNIYQTYQDEIGLTVVRIGFLVGQASQRGGVDEQSLAKALDALIDNIVQKTERMARIDPEQFALGCRSLPTAISKKTGPFESLHMKFPLEMKIIEGRFAIED
jgi:hypothetical protein